MAVGDANIANMKENEFVDANISGVEETDIISASENVQIYVIEDADEIAEFLMRINIQSMTEASVHKISGILRTLGCRRDLRDQTHSIRGNRQNRTRGG